MYLFNFKVLKQLCMGETKNELILSLLKLSLDNIVKFKKNCIDPIFGKFFC